MTAAVRERLRNRAPRTPKKRERPGRFPRYIRDVQPPPASAGVAAYGPQFITASQVLHAYAVLYGECE